MARRTWILILLVTVFLGASFIGLQIYMYQKCTDALRRISLPTTKISIEKFNFQIHRSRISLSNISIKNKMETLKIEELIIQFDPSIYSKDDLVINTAEVKGILLPSKNVTGRVFSKFFKSNLMVSKSAAPLMINTLIVKDIRTANEKSYSQKQLKSPIRRYKLKTRTAKLNGSMDFLVHVIYFILQNSLGEAQRASGLRIGETGGYESKNGNKSLEDSLSRKMIRSFKSAVESVFGSN